jgi:CBS domain-containing protein
MMLVRDRMSTPPITVRADTSFQEALALMQVHDIRRVPVVDERGALVGIVAQRDVLIAALRFLQSRVEVSEVMAAPVVTVSSDTTLASVAKTMLEKKIGGLPVVDGDRLAGIFTERDVLTRVVAAGRRPEDTRVADVMSSDLVVAEVNESCEECLSRMQRTRVRHLIVLDQGRLAGILSLRDLLAADCDEKAEAITLLNAYVHYIPADLQAKLRT